jgi:hypothetical protein
MMRPNLGIHMSPVQPQPAMIKEMKNRPEDPNVDFIRMQTMEQKELNISMII